MTGARFARHRNDGVYRTPDDFRDAVGDRFGWPAIDLACDTANQFGPEGVTPADDSLSLDWALLATVQAYGWLNPPYGDIGAWARKSAESGARVLMLVPASIGANWFRDYVWGRARVYALNGRMSFDGVNPYPKDLILCDYGDEPGLEIWTWKKNR